MSCVVPAISPLPPVVHKCYAGIVQQPLLSMSLSAVLGQQPGLQGEPLLLPQSLSLSLWICTSLIASCKHILLLCSMLQRHQAWQSGVES